MANVGLTVPDSLLATLKKAPHEMAPPCAACAWAQDVFFESLNELPHRAIRFVPLIASGFMDYLLRRRAPSGRA